MIFDVNGFDPTNWQLIPAQGTAFPPRLQPANSARMPFPPLALPGSKVQPRGVTGAAAGTFVLTARGPVAIEALVVGDLVLTADHGYQPLRWSGARALTALDLAKSPEHAPLRIRAGALGPAQPAADLLVSPQHQILVRGAWLERLFDLREALILARHLLELDGVEPACDLAEITYYHLLFDSHEVIFMNGAKTGSLENGPAALAQIDPEVLDEVLANCPAFGRASASPPCGARPLVDEAERPLSPRFS